MLREAEETLAVAVNDGIRRNHLGIKQRVFRQLTVKDPAMPVRPIHHRRDAEPMCLVSHDFSTIKYDAAMQGPVMSATSVTFITYISVRTERAKGRIEMASVDRRIHGAVR